MITPFHIAAATPIKLLFPKQFSLLWFSIVNVLIDIEVIYYFLITGYPSHKFFHSILGVSIIGFGCFFLSVLFKQKPNAGSKKKGLQKQGKVTTCGK